MVCRRYFLVRGAEGKHFVEMIYRGRGSDMYLFMLIATYNSMICMCNVES